MAAAPSQPARIFLLLICAILVLAQVSGAHLHLCFDGIEPPVSTHLTEDGNADLHPGASGTHVDMDVSFVGNALVKKAATGFDLIPLLVTGVVLFGAIVLSYGKQLLPSRPDTFIPAAPFELRPPLRGPPV